MRDKNVTLLRPHETCKEETYSIRFYTSVYALTGTSSNLWLDLVVHNYRNIKPKLAWRT